MQCDWILQSHNLKLTHVIHRAHVCPTRSNFSGASESRCGTAYVLIPSNTLQYKCTQVSMEHHNVFQDKGPFRHRGLERRIREKKCFRTKWAPRTRWEIPSFATTWTRCLDIPKVRSWDRPKATIFLPAIVIGWSRRSGMASSLGRAVMKIFYYFKISLKSLLSLSPPRCRSFDNSSRSSSAIGNDGSAQAHLRSKVRRTASALGNCLGTHRSCRGYARIPAFGDHDWLGGLSSLSHYVGFND